MSGKTGVLSVIRAISAMLALAGGGMAPDAAAAVLHVGAGCTYGTLASAVTAAKANPGADTIALNNGAFAITQTVTVEDTAALTIEGGYANCSATVSTGSSTLDANTKSSTGTVIFHHAAGALTLQHLRIANNDTMGSYGGAVFSSQAGPLTLHNVMLDHNTAYAGAGVYVFASGGLRGHLTLIDTRIEYCIADHSGGGIGAEQTDIEIYGDTEITINDAGAAGDGDGDGGGIWLKNGSLRVKGHTESGRQLLGSNSAERRGGGLYWEIQGTSALLLLQNDRADQPLVIENNAAPDGGGFYVRNSYTGSSTANVMLWNTIFSRNTATSGKGAALYLDAAASGGAMVYAALLQSAAGDAIPACATGLECNAFTENEASNGSIIQAQHSTTGNTSTFLHLQRAYLRDNSARTGLAIGNGEISVDNSLIVGNYINYPYIYLLNVTSNALSVSNTTIASNVLAADSAAVYTYNGTLNFYHNLVDQPGAFVCIASLPVAVSARDVGYTAGTGPNQCNGVNSKLVEPLFVDPDNGDFHLGGYGSGAMDTWSASGNAFVPQLDLDGARRPAVIADANRPYDYGAYEWGAVVEKIFVNGFETQ